jgi:D-alanyl-D-alanine carboxypeptidase
MQIHELTQRKKVKEGIASAFGLDKSEVRQAWGDIGGQLVQGIAARFTKDPRYANLPMDQRIRAMQHDQDTAEAARTYTDSWNNYINQITVRNGSQPLDDATYRAVLSQWATKTVFDNNLNAVTPDMKQKIDATLDAITAARANPKTIEANMRQLAVYAGSVVIDAIKAAGAAPGASVQHQATPLASGVTVVSSSPVVLSYRNKDYALTNNDTWVFFGSNKSPSAEMVAFLNKQLQSL